MIQITIAVPMSMIYAANQLARCIGYTEDDTHTFTQAPQINGYAVASGLVHEAFLTNAFQPLVEPEWGSDMEAAREAQAAVVIVETGEESVPDKILVVIGHDREIALALMDIDVK